MTIPFVDLGAQFRRLEPEIRAAIDRVLAHGKFIMGPEVAELEEKLADFVAVDHCITCSSGTDALLMPLMAWEIGPGDAVFTTAFSFVATAEVISLLGATPVFVDIDPRTFNIDPNRLEEAIAAVQSAGELKAKAIIPVDLFGLPADYPAIEPIAAKHDLLVIEDAAQSLGGAISDRKAGSFGHAAATSFFPAKPLGCYGDGGAIFTDDAALADVLRSIRVHGQGAHKYDNVRLGLNARLDTLQAAILLAKLAAFPAELARRQDVAARYSERLAHMVETPFVPESYTSASAQYALLHDRRDQLVEMLHSKGVPSRIYYPKSLHLQKAFMERHVSPGHLVNSGCVSKRILSIPFGPDLDLTEQDQICMAIEDACKILNIRE